MANNSERVHLLRPAPTLPALPNQDIASQVREIRSESQIAVLQAELRLWQERSAYKTEMLLDEAEWLQGILDTNEPEAREAMRRRISRLRGAAARFEGKVGE